MGIEDKKILSKLKEGRDKHVKRIAVLNAEVEFHQKELPKYDKAIEDFLNRDGSMNYLVQNIREALANEPQLPQIEYVKEIAALFNKDKRKKWMVREAADRICEAYAITYNPLQWEVRRRVESQVKRWVKAGRMEMIEGRRGEAKSYRPTKEW